MPHRAMRDNGRSWRRRWPHLAGRLQQRLVPVERIELPTFGLQNRCTTAVLHRRTRFEAAAVRSCAAVRIDAY